MRRSLNTACEAHHPCVPLFRLQPSAVVTDEDCAACDFNRPGKTCLRKMEWVWRGETYAATSAEYFSLKNQLQVRAPCRLHRGGGTLQSVAQMGGWGCGWEEGTSLSTPSK